MPSFFAPQDLLLLAIQDYVSNVEKKSITLLPNDVFSSFDRLCSYLNALCSMLTSQSSVRIKLLLCQCTARGSKIISSIGLACSLSHFNEMPGAAQLSCMATATQALASAVMSIRQHCETSSYPVSMMFWSACEALSCVIDTPMRPKSRREEETTVPVRPDYASSKMVFDALRATAPSPNDLFYEVKTLHVEGQNSSGPSDTGQRNDHSNSVGDTSLDATRGGLPGSFRLQYLIDGLQMLLRAGALECKKGKQRY
jgi:hypothetical protein